MIMIVEIVLTFGVIILVTTCISLERRVKELEEEYERHSDYSRRLFYDVLELENRVVELEIKLGIKELEKGRIEEDEINKREEIK